MKKRQLFKVSGEMVVRGGTMGKGRVERRRLKAAGAVHNGENASGAEAAEGRRSCSQWDSAVFTMRLDARLSVKCAFGAFRLRKQIA